MISTSAQHLGFELQSRGLLSPACRFVFRWETSSCSRENTTDGTITSLSEEDIVINRTRKLVEIKIWVECFRFSCATAR